MRVSTPLWSLTVLAPLVLVPTIALAFLGAAGNLLPSLTVIGQVLVAGLSVFAIWAGLSTRGH